MTQEEDRFEKGSARLENRRAWVSEKGPWGAEGWLLGVLWGWFQGQRPHVWGPNSILKT